MRRRIDAPELPDVVAVPLLPEDCGKVALVSLCDLDRVADLPWRYFVTNPGTSGYAVLPSRRGKPVYLHRYLLDAPSGVLVDHRDGDGLNNTRENIRLCSTSGNRRNSRKHRHRRGLPTVSRYKGLSVDSRTKCWNVNVHTSERTHYVGYFHDEEEAARAYDDAARDLFGEFACLNFPRPGERSALTGEIVATVAPPTAA
jgi:hypothetical protein